MPFPTQTPSHSPTMMDNENVLNVGACEFPEFSTQMTLGGTGGVSEATPHAEDSAHSPEKSQMEHWAKFGVVEWLDKIWNIQHCWWK